MSGSILARAFRERRNLALPLAVALLVNAGVAALVVYPLTGRVGAAADQERAAQQELGAAQRDFVLASTTRDDRAKAALALNRFYEKVLPADLAGARRATYVLLAQLARSAELQYQRRLEESLEPGKADQGQGPRSDLTRFDITLVLKGAYESVRQFLRDVEASDRFIVIDNVTLAEGAESGSALVLTVDMSTFFRTAERGK
jgi:Tfp pilus assembly protein PilO